MSYVAAIIWGITVTAVVGLDPLDWKYYPLLFVTALWVWSARHDAAKGAQSKEEK